MVSLVNIFINRRVTIRIDVDASLAAGGMTQSVSGRMSEIGDVTLIPFAFYWQTGKLHMSRVEFIITPTGDYSMTNLS